MLIKIATRVLNEEQFIDTFIQYYLDLGVDEIHFFDSGSQDQTLNIIKNWSRKNPAVKLIISDHELRHTSSSIETRVCNRILQHAMQDTVAYGDDCWWLFPDIDEFLRPPQPNLKKFFAETDNQIIRSVFFEWYLPPDELQTAYSLPQIIDLVHNGQLKGKLLDLLDDPFYKDDIILLSPENIKKYATLRTIAGNHRYLLNDEIIVPPNEPFLVIDHLKGLSIKHIQNRIDKWMLLLDNQLKKSPQDDWTLEHFRQIKEQMVDYSAFFDQKLLTFAELEAKKPEIARYDNELSLYNTIAF